MRPFAAALFLIAAGFWSAAPVDGQVQPDTVKADSLAAPVYEIQGVQVSVARPSTSGGATSTVELSLDSVAIQPAPTLEQVLRSMPLVQIRTNSRGEAQPALRGAEDRQIAVLMDGVPLTLGWDARTDLSIIPLSAARNIRIVRGLSSVLMGPNVLGGAVEVDVASGPDGFPPPPPVQASLGVDHTGGTSLAASGGIASETRGGTLEVRGGAGFRTQDGFALASSLQDDPDLRQPYLTDDGDLRLNTDLQRVDGFFSGRFQTEEGAWFSATGSGISLERGVAPEAHVDDPRLWRYPKQDRLVGALAAGTGFRDTPLGRGDLELSLGMDLGRTEIEAFDSEAFDEVVETEEGDDRALTVRATGDLALTDRMDLRASGTYGHIRHDETVDDGPATRYVQRIWSFAGEVERRFDSFLGVSGLTGTRLTLGAALDGSDTPESGDKPPLDQLWDWGARAGVSTLAGQRTLVHASVSRRTRFPALRELYSGALGRFEPNPDLRPEELLAGELGFTVSGSRGEFQAVGFHQRLRDGIVRTSVTDPLGNRKFKRVNQDEVRSTGLEVLASALLGPLTLSGDLTLQKVRGIEADGSEVKLEYEPAVAGKLGARGPLPMTLIGFADLSYVGDQYCENPEIGGLESFGSSTRVDLGLSRVFTLRSGGALQRMEASAAVNNVADAALFDQCGLPQPGRTFSVGLRIW